MKKLLFLIVLIISVILTNYFLRRKYNNDRVIDLSRYEMYQMDKNIFNVTNIEDDYNASKVLYEVVSGFYSWNQLPLTEHFKEKFLNRNKIVKIDSSIYTISSFLKYNENAENNIVITLYRKENGIIKYLLGPKNTVYVFNYKLLDGRLDDIELVDKYDEDALTGKKF